MLFLKAEVNTGVLASCATTPSMRCTDCTVVIIKVGMAEGAPVGETSLTVATSAAYADSKPAATMY